MTMPAWYRKRQIAVIGEQLQRDRAALRVCERENPKEMYPPRAVHRPIVDDRMWLIVHGHSHMCTHGCVCRN